MDHQHHLPGQAVSSSSNSCYSTEEIVSVNMSFPIPEPYCWDESFKVFYENIDEEHRCLFKGIADVCMKPTDPHMMEKLIEVTTHHFADEEGMMKRAKYGDYPTHKTMHDEFVRKLKGMHCPVSTADMDYAKEWLVTHIKGTDFKYKKML